MRNLLLTFVFMVLLMMYLLLTFTYRFV